MIKLYSYIFFRVYNFYLRVFNEKEIPHYFACGIVVILLMSNVAILTEFLYLKTGQNFFLKLTGYVKYASLILLFVGILMVNRNNYYKPILNRVSKYNHKQRSLLAYLSVFYLLITLVLFFYLGIEIRKLN